MCMHAGGTIELTITHLNSDFNPLAKEQTDQQQPDQQQEDGEPTKKALLKETLSVAPPPTDDDEFDVHFDTTYNLNYYVNR